MKRWNKMLSGFLAWLTLAFLPAAAAAPAATAIRLPAGVVHVATVEGISEYRLANGLRCVLFPDAGKPTATVNVTYLVGSRHENYGETGMAHLLEHLIFKGSKKFPDPARQFQARGFEINGSTWLDRTNYYLTFPAGDDNLRWALAWSSDAMVNSFIARKDLDSEMSVVRNEFEMGENEPASVMFKRMQSLLFDWHNYGNSTIGARSDIENVRIENLQAFYRRFYQPDNAVLTVAGRFDEQKALDWIVGSFGKLPRPKRVLPEQWTVEPTADGERQFVIRRKGEVQLLTVAYRTPASLHPDAEAISIAGEVLGDTPNGRLYRALVQTGLATQVFAYPVDTREPGFVVFGAVVARGESLERAREAMLEVIEGGLARQPTTAAELERALAEARTSYERALSDPESFAVMLSEYIALGDWRLFFHARDQLEQITAARVDAAAARYLVRDNRVLGVFIPDDSPQRAVLPKAPSAAERLAGYRPAERGDAGEAFDPAYANIDRRTRVSSFGDLKVALLPKKNRGQTVNVAMSFRWGDEQSLKNRKMAGALAIAMLPRGTRQLSRQQIADELTRLKVRGGMTQFETTRDKLPEALALAAQLLSEPSFPPAEFEELRREYLTALQSQLDSPEQLAGDALASHFNTYPPGDPRHHTPLPERIEQLRRLELDAVVAYQRDLVGTARGEIAIVGDFDPQAIEDELRRLFADYRSQSAYQRLEREFRPVPPRRIVIDAPDKENAFLRARLDIDLQRDDADAAALYVANYIFGNSGGLSSRLMDRLRQKDGLSYSVASSLSIGQRERLSTWTVAAMVAPQNAARAERALLEELRRARDAGFGAAEVTAAKTGIVEASAVARSQDAAIASGWTSLLDRGRDWRDSQAFEARIMAVTPEQASAAFRKYIDPEQMTLVLAGDGSKGLGK
ncbi:MAG TPA: pitrilysin family protein [Candidatus Accumulibacter phosphatis]|nr:MAG: Protease 3 precursor [Candidatus Accumulibacter sp. SK-11]HAY29102.1 insulinase family protein [Accumulibacter sp.]HRL77578.1 pitrilysin family protein [Candidatus Accumulibacter phosphatis]HCN69162.1 insulinase family protein [Accumulibacter sp.]HCV12640.1 insulinase family protein [Accumulibacter sp.]